MRDVVFAIRWTGSNPVAPAKNNFMRLRSLPYYVKAIPEPKAVDFAEIWRPKFKKKYGDTVFVRGTTKFDRNGLTFLIKNLL